MSRHLLVGGSFVDPSWQDVKTWSLHYGEKYPSLIVAKAGLGIKGICTEAYYYLKELPDISTVVIMLPDLWKIDIEVSDETYLCNSMTDLIEVRSDGGYIVLQPAVRKWIKSGSLSWEKGTEQAPIFNFLVKHQGYLVIAKEHFRALKLLLNLCQERKIKYLVTSTSDPMKHLVGLDYIKPGVEKALAEVEYSNWAKFDNGFVDEFLGFKQPRHPNSSEQKILCEYIFKMIGQ